MGHKEEQYIYTHDKQCDWDTWNYCCLPLPKEVHLVLRITHNGINIITEKGGKKSIHVGDTSMTNMRWSNLVSITRM